MSEHNSLSDVIKEDTLRLDQTIVKQLNSPVSLVNEVASYIIQSGGKRLRPKILILVAKTFSYEGTKHIDLAAIIEFIHVATLLHDDVIDQSEYRRSRPTAHKKFSNMASVLVGDFLYTRAFQMMVNVEKQEVFSILADATNKIAEGEVMQLVHIGSSKLSEQDYFNIIEHKTACLFESACWLGGIIAGVEPSQLVPIKKFGHCLGVVFQMIDDVLDYTSDSEVIGKSIGDDLKEGKLTLPLIIALKRSNEEERNVILEAVNDPTNDNLFEVLKIIKRTNSIEETKNKAQKIITEAFDCLECFPKNSYSDQLKIIAEQAIERRL